MKLGYARISTTDQNASMQVQALREVGVAKERIFIDEMSGMKAARERPQMVKLLDYAREGDEIFVWRIDRLGRSLVDVVNTVQEITDKGIKLYSIMDGVDPSSAHVLRRSSRCLILEGSGTHRRALLTSGRRPYGKTRLVGPA